MLKLDIDRLLKDEVIFELRCRGAHVSEDLTLKELVKLLRELVNLEHEGKSFRCDYSFVAKDELEIIKDKLLEIKTLLSGEFTRSLTRKLETKLCHVMNRLEKVETEDESEQTVKSQLFTEALTYVSQYREKLTSFKVPVNVDVLELEINNHDNKATSTPKSSPSVNGHNPQPKGSDMVEMFERICMSDSSSISKWGIKFSGESEVGLNAFLERVNELCESRGVSKEKLFNCATELFEGKALILFRSIRDKVCDWENLCVALKQEFLPSDYNERLWEQIKQRTQGDRESIGIYIAYMNNLFNRLSTPVSEDVKLKIILKNILPYYQTHLTLVKIDSLEHLVELCRKLETSRERIAKFIPPVSDKNVIEPDLAYRQIRRKLDNIQVEVPQVSFSETVREVGEDKYSGKKCKKGDFQTKASRSRDSSRSSCHSIESINQGRQAQRGDSGNRFSRERHGREGYSRDRYEDKNRGKFFGDRNRSGSRDRDVYGREHRDRQDNNSGYFEARRSGYDNKDTDTLGRGNQHSHFSRYDTFQKPRDNSFGRARDFSGCRDFRDSRGHKSYFQRKDDLSDVVNSFFREKTCYLCKGKNHLSKHCTAKRCFNCGLAGYTKFTCPICNKSGNDRGN